MRISDNIKERIERIRPTCALLFASSFLFEINEKIKPRIENTSVPKNRKETNEKISPKIEYISLTFLSSIKYITYDIFCFYD